MDDISRKVDNGVGFVVGAAEVSLTTSFSSCIDLRGLGLGNRIGGSLWLSGDTEAESLTLPLPLPSTSKLVYK